MTTQSRRNVYTIVITCRCFLGKMDGAGGLGGGGVLYPVMHFRLDFMHLVEKLGYSIDKIQFLIV